MSQRAAERLFEQALHEDDPRALYEQAPCGYLSLLPDGRVLKTNRTLRTWTGYEDAAELVGRHFTDLLSVGSRLYLETHVRPLLLMHGQVREIALDMVRADGSSLPVLLNAVLDRAKDGEPGVTRVAVFDATERRRYERELLAAKQRAEESERRAAELARTLQETLMPPRNPRIEGMDVATGYRPAGSGDEIGGDFYDVFEVAQHHWVVSLGDVSGKGVTAATVATLARHTIRAVAVNVESPAEVLRQLNNVMLSNGTERFCTAILLRLRRVGDRWDVTMSAGGHPPAIVLDEGRAPRTIGQPSSLIGAFESVSFDDIRFELRGGATLLLHTDGVTEARRCGQFYGEDRLMRLLHGNTEGPEGLVGRILGDVLRFQGGAARDDIALVALRVRSPGD